MAKFKQKKYRSEKKSEYQIEIRTSKGLKLLKEVYIGIENAKKGKDYFTRRGIIARVQFKRKEND